MPIVPRGRHIRSNGIRLHYLEFLNDKPPLLVIPGITMPAACWGFVGERLARHSHVYLLDPRGRGLSEGGPRLGYRLDDYAADLIGLLRGLGLQQADVLGHSMGARIAVRFAASFPEAVGRLVLVDPPMTGPGRRAYPTPLSAFLDAIDLAGKGKGREEMARALGWTDEQIDLRMQWLPTCGKEAVAGSYASFVEEDIHADLPSVRARTLLMYAGLGGTVTDEEALEVVSLLRDGVAQRVDGAGHMIPWDALEIFCEGVEAFLVSSSGRSPDKRKKGDSL